MSKCSLRVEEQINLVDYAVSVSDSEETIVRHSGYFWRVLDVTLAPSIVV